MENTLMFIALMILCIKPFVWDKGKMSRLQGLKGRIKA